MKLDNYFNNGSIEMARDGTHTIVKNNMNTMQHQKMLKIFKKKYPKLKKKIKRLITLIRKQVCRCDPIELLSFSSDMFLMSNLGITSEIQSSKEDIFISRMTEYIQSIIVSSSIEYRKLPKNSAKIFLKIQRNIIKLYELVYEFYFSWLACGEELYPEFDDECRRAIFESQFLYTVRGQRYQVFEIEYFERLLKSHNDIFISLFDLTSSEIVEGIKKLQHSLSQGKFDEINELGEFMDDFFENGEMDIENFMKSHPDAGQKFANNFFGTNLRDVVDVTGWPQKFVKSLSWEIGECQNFFDEKEFAGWPIIDLPIQKRPFIKIDDSYYCFDYYSFVDNFYRAIQKAVSRENPNYNWSDSQKHASENMVSDVFADILSGCVIHSDNYYPKNKSLKNLNENDIIIIYANTLFIVEVKAGSFVFTPPITDFRNHIISYKNLIEKADHQCKNTYDYLTATDTAILYNQDGSIKAQIDMTEIDDIFMFSVTIDNINDFAARAEKLNFLNLKCNAISLSIDDLMVYRNYFDSPLQFLHFLKQRRQATLESKLALNDELDHLGMYINHNMYCLQLKDYPDDAEIIFHGYREALDEYFCSLYHPLLKQEKPTQPIPPLFWQLIEHLDKNDLRNKVTASNYLFDFSTESKQQLCQYIEYALQRQKQTGNMLAFSFMGDGETGLRITGFVEQPGIRTFTEDYKREYLLSTLAWNEEPDRFMLDLEFDTKNTLIKFKFKKFSEEDYLEGEFQKVFQKGKERAVMRIQTYIKQYGKIDDSETCPCASGKTYSECCKIKLNI